MARKSGRAAAKKKQDSPAKAAEPAPEPEIGAEQPEATPAPPRTSPPAPWDLPERRWLLVPAGLLAAAALLRFVGLGAKGLWFDEVHTLTNSMYPPPPSELHRLFFAIDHFFQRFGSNPTVGARIYPALAGTLAVPTLFLFVARIHSRLAGWIAAVALALQPFHLFHSQEARFYAPMVFFAVAALWAGVEFAIEPRLRRFAWLAAAVSSHFLAWQNHPASQPFVLAHLAGLGLVLIAGGWGIGAERREISPRGWRMRAAIGVAGAAVIFILLIAVPLLPSQISQFFDEKLRPLASLRRQIAQVFSNKWGETPNVDFAWKFFAGHIDDFGWDVRRWPLLGAPGRWATISLAAIGLAVMARRRPSFAIWLGGIVVAAFLAIFGFKTSTYYQNKYAAFLQPIVLAFFAVGLARAAEIIWARLPAAAKAKPRAAWIFAAAIAALLVVGELPGAVRHYRLEKMPLRPQIRWLNENEPAAARVFIYGHGGFPASLYRNEFAARHEIHYFPWVKDEGRLEWETLAGSAATGRPTYYIQCWPWDAPGPLLKKIKSECQEAARFRSIEGPDYDGVVYRAPPPKGSEHRDADRPAAAIDGFGALGRPAIRYDKQGNSRLSFAAAAQVSYNIPLKAGEARRISVRGMAERESYYFVTATAGGETVVLGGLCKPGQEFAWSGPLTPKSDADSLTVAYASDYGAAPGDTAREFSLTRFSAAPAQANDPPPSGWIRMPPLRAPGDGKPQSSGATRWIPGEKDQFRIVQNPGEGFTRMRMRPDSKGHVLTEAFPIEPGGILHLRVPARLHEAFGFGATVEVQFFNKDRVMAGRRLLSSAPMGSNVDWDPWIEPLEAGRWREHEIVMPVPPDATTASVAASAWPTSRSVRYEKAANELHVGAVEYAAGPNPFEAATK